MPSRVVIPETKTIPISNGDSITIRKRLNIGEEREVLRRAGGNSLILSREWVVGYLLDWTLTNPDGTLIKIADQSPEMIQQALDSLDGDSFREIREAVEGHMELLEAERAEQKKIRDGEMTSSPTSPSVASSAGLLTGSVN